jgi:prephenate dehydrogenase
MVAAVIGTGLIGGSFALDLKDSGFCNKIIGVDSNNENAVRALELNLVDEVSDLPCAVNKSDLIIIAVPVNALPDVLSSVLDITDGQTIIDVGSTKVPIIASAAKKRNRGRFVATHPIWGTENSGPESAMKGKLNGNITVICNSRESDEDALHITEKMYDTLGMKRVYMEAEEHDLHAAYISHFPHVTSFALALSVLEKEKEANTILRLAGAGFESAVRLAKSSPDMWTPILQQNRCNVLDVLNEHINQLNQFKKFLEMEDYDAVYKLIGKANEIRKIFSKKDL